MPLGAVGGNGRSTTTGGSADDERSGNVGSVGEEAHIPPDDAESPHQDLDDVAVTEDVPAADGLAVEPG